MGYRKQFQHEANVDPVLSLIIAQYRQQKCKFVGHLTDTEDLLLPFHSSYWVSGARELFYKIVL